MIAEENRKNPLADDPRVFLAAERTLLAWIRTGLALMGFGFVVARFGLFLHELALVRGASLPPPSRPHFSLWIGTAMVIVGVLVNIIAAAQHARFVRLLKQGRSAGLTDSRLGLALAALLALLGLGVAIYLLRLT